MWEPQTLHYKFHFVFSGCICITPDQKILHKWLTHGHFSFRINGSCRKPSSIIQMHQHCKSDFFWYKFPLLAYVWWAQPIFLLQLRLIFSALLHMNTKTFGAVSSPSPTSNIIVRPSFLFLLQPPHTCC